MKYLRWLIAGALLAEVWLHVHWSVGLIFTLMFINSEMSKYVSSKVTKVHLAALEELKKEMEQKYNESKQAKEASKVAGNNI